MIILRKGNKTKFWYEDVNGAKITDKKILEYVEGLHVPPAYVDVHIFYVKKPKILFQGHDAAGRLQQIYSPAHCKAACKRKFQSLIDFGHALPKIFADCERHMSAAKSTKNKVIAVIVKIISLCYFRVGNTKYVRLYDHHGISTITVNHVKKMANGLHIQFVGKKGVVNECTLKDPKIIKALGSLVAGKRPQEHVFEYQEGADRQLISAAEINDWLRQYGEDFSTKMFRNFDANLLFIEFVRQEHEAGETLTSVSESKRKKILVAAMKEVSQDINNTPAICKKAYMSPDLIKLYLEHPKKFNSMFMKPGSARIAFINYLKSL